MKKKTMVDPKKKGMLSAMGSFLCDVRKIESSSDSEVKEFFDLVKTRTEYTSVEDMPDPLQTLRADIISTLELDHDLKTSVVVYPQQESVDKKKTYTLPKPRDNVVVRVVLVYGSHEIFYSKGLEKVMGPIGSFVHQGSAIKILPSSGDFWYDNKDDYDRETYPGSGKKRPTKRQLAIFDFISESEDVSKKIKSQEITRITGLVTKIPQASQIILPLLKSFSSL